MHAKSVLLLILSICACTPKSQDKAVDSLHQDIVRLTRETASLRTELAAARQREAAASQHAVEIENRVHQLELRAMTVALPATPSSDLPRSTSSNAAVPAPAETTRRGGFTDWGESRLTARLPVAASSTTSESRTRSSERSGPITSDPVIINYCAQEWKTNYRMIAYCQEQQQNAKEQLARGNVYGISGSGFDVIRRDCAREWPGNYSMQLYCEKNQSEAYKAVNR